jgi:hypothetical protein
VILDLSADVLIAPFSHDGEIIGGPGLNTDVNIHRQRSSIKRRPQVGRSGRQRQSEVGLFKFLRRHQILAPASCRLSRAHLALAPLDEILPRPINKI